MRRVTHDKLQTNHLKNTEVICR